MQLTQIQNEFFVHQNIVTNDKAKTSIIVWNVIDKGLEIVLVVANIIPGQEKITTTKYSALSNVPINIIQKLMRKEK